MPRDQANDWWQQLTAKATHLRLAVIGAGVLGDTGAMPWLMARMDNPMLARVAGEALTMISGCDLAAEDLEGDAPEGFDVGPSEHPEHEDVSLDPDEHLPWPDTQRIQQWWQGQSQHLPGGVRLFLGNPLTKEGLHEVLKSGMQRQRAAAALEMGIMNLGHPMFEVRAPAIRQRALLQS